MDERERGRLLSKLKLLKSGFERELEELRQSRRLLGDARRDCPICHEIAFLADYVDRFSSGAIQLAKDASKHPLALKIAREHCLDLHDRLHRHLSWYRANRKWGSVATPAEKDRVLRRFDSAVRTAVMRLDDAGFDFDELPLATRQQPTISVVDRWIRESSATNSKEAWRQITNQRDFPPPLWKVFYERWRKLRPAQRGRPKKRPN